MTSPDEVGNATRLMIAAGAGDKDAADRLLPLVFEQLRRAAQRELAHERTGHTLSATALVHEAYLKLAGPRHVPWAGRGHFYAAAAEAMRRILVEHARARLARKRGGPDRRRLRFDIAGVADLACDEKPEEIVALDDAIRRLGDQEPRVADVVRLRFFAGLSVADTAGALGVSPRTVELDWSFGRAWLYRALGGQQQT